MSHSQLPRWRHFLRLDQALVRLQQFVGARRHLCARGRSFSARRSGSTVATPRHFRRHRQHHRRRDADERLQEQQRVVRRRATERAEAAQRAVDGDDHEAAPQLSAVTQAPKRNADHSRTGTMRNGIVGAAWAATD